MAINPDSLDRRQSPTRAEDVWPLGIPPAGSEARTAYWSNVDRLLGSVQAEPPASKHPTPPHGLAMRWKAAIARFTQH